MIKQVHAEILAAERLRAKYLDRGTSPTAEQQVAVAVSAARDAGPSAPLKTEPGEEASCAKLRAGIDSFAAQMRAISASCDLIDGRFGRCLDQAENRLAVAGAEAARIMLQACALQSGRRHGLPYVFVDTFGDLTRVDQAETSALVDVDERAVRLPSAPQARRHDLTALSSRNFDVFMVSGSSLGFSPTPGSTLGALFDDGDGCWIQRVLAADESTKTIALQLDLEREYPVSRIAFDPLADDREGSLLFRVLVSANGVNWTEVMPKARSIAATVVADFDGFDVRYVRLEVTAEKSAGRLGDSTASFVYYFGLHALRLYDATRFPAAEFCSLPIRFRDVAGNAQRVNRLWLEVYEEKPAGTEISYFLAKDPANLDSMRLVAPKTEIVLDARDEVRAQGRVRRRYDVDHAVVDIDLPTEKASAADPLLVADTLRLFRNVRIPGLLVGGVASGWTLVDGVYRCVFEAAEDAEIDLGKNYAWLDGRKVNGLQYVSAGFHDFRTPAANWAEAHSETDDPLYPHNHRLIVEGLPGSTTYPGMTFVAAAELQLVSAFDLVQNVPAGDARFFAVTDGRPLVKVPRPPVDASADQAEAWRSEHYAVRYEASQEDIGSTEVVLFARLTTSNRNVSPALKGYMIAAGC